MGVGGGGGVHLRILRLTTSSGAGGGRGIHLRTITPTSSSEGVFTSEDIKPYIII